MKSKSSYIMAGVVALAVVGWMFSDDLLQKYGGDKAKEIAKHARIVRQGGAPDREKGNPAQSLLGKYAHLA